MALARRGSRRWSARICRPARRACSRALSGFAVLAAGLWAGFLWGADGQLPLLISGIVGGVFAVALLAVAFGGRYISGTASSTSSSANGGTPTPTTE